MRLIDEHDVNAVSGGCTPGGNPGDGNDNGIPDSMEPIGLPPIKGPGDKRSHDQIR